MTWQLIGRWTFRLPVADTLIKQLANGADTVLQNVFLVCMKNEDMKCNQHGQYTTS